MINAIQTNDGIDIQRSDIIPERKDMRLEL